jgi:hypothetical protein
MMHYVALSLLATRTGYQVMAMLIVDHHLKNFDDWIGLFKANPPPSVGSWRLMRGSEDPNRVYVIGDFSDSQAADIRAYFESEKMLAVFRQVDAMSEQPMDFVWLNDV